MFPFLPSLVQRSEARPTRGSFAGTAVFFLAVTSFGPDLPGCGASGTGQAGPSTEASGAGGSGGGSPEGDVSSPPPQSTCIPGSVSSFLPVYKTPIGPYAGACSATQLQGLVASCFGDQTDECMRWVEDNGPCAYCAVGPAWAEGGKPLLVPVDGAVYVVNEAACIALSDPSELTCAEETEYAFECEVQACALFCPIGPDATGADQAALNDCFDAAFRGGCWTYGEGAKKCQETLADGPAAYCHEVAAKPTAHSGRELLHFLALACGPSLANGDGGDDAGSEQGEDAGAAADGSYDDDAPGSDASPADAFPLDASTRDATLDVSAQ